MRSIHRRDRKLGWIANTAALPGTALHSFKSTSSKLTPALTIAFFTFVIVGCASNPDPHSAPTEVPDSFATTPSASTQHVNTTGWWHDFGDPVLDTLVARALSDNFDLKAAWARYRQSIAIADQVGSARLPQVTASASTGRSKIISYFTGTPKAQTSDQFGLSLGAQYEVDVWGRLADLDQAATLESAAGREDAASLAMSIAAFTVETWRGLIAQTEQLRLLQSQVSADSTYLVLVELRFASGLASAVDVYQQRRQSLATQTEIPPTEASITVLRHQLAVLTGQQPTSLNSLDVSGNLTLPPLPETGLPVEMLDARPDVRAAWLRLRASDHRVAAAAKDRLPAVRLSGSLGLSATELSTLFDDWVYGISAGVVAPLFDGGRRRAAVRQQRAAVDAALAMLGSTMLTALREVEDALVRENRQREYVVRLDEQVEVTERLLEEAIVRYREGLSDYLPVLNSVQALHRLQRAQIGARAQLSSYRVQLHRALGGTWTDSLGISDTAEEQPAGQSG
jgi:outer membrane protein, multidrug efflux system